MRRTVKAWILGCLLSVSTLLMFSNEIEAAEKIWFYLDGQEQRYQGDIEFFEDEIWLPVRPILLKAVEINEEWNIDSAYITRLLKGELEEEEEIEELCELEIVKINNRDMIKLSDVELLGFDAYFYEQEAIVHVNTPQLMVVENLTIGMTKEEVNEELSGIHWNTGFGKKADYIGFYGEMNSFSYKDRYGYTRTGEVPDIQIEIIENEVTYLLIATNQLETSKGIKVGDRLTDAIRAYGSQNTRFQEDGKQIVVYDVEFGSIWFIAENQKIERIGIWDHHLYGFGEQKEKEEEDL
ncbi:hypothetical protein [Halalkalibacter urbisdiaboli]|uniref:hypothetical protein n=1 Tax=Halalkalibacter urbisdiaboli TaxID=1960589 RepID=UPI000B443704|nr:hypothetical protein [Halalkalibacter urbisdiaboli]